MSRSNSIRRRLAERAGSLGAAALRFPTHVIAPAMLGVICLLEEPTATAAYAAAASFGGLLLIRALAARRGSHQPCQTPAELRRMRGVGYDTVDRNHR